MWINLVNSTVFCLRHKLIPPSDITISNETNSSFVVSWGAVARATGYYVDIAYDENFEFLVQENLYTTQTSKTFYGLNEYTQYYVRIRTVNSYMNSTNSQNEEGQTTVYVPPPADLVDISEINFSLITNTSFTTSWNPIEDTEGYEIEYFISSNPSTSLPDDPSIAEMFPHYDFSIDINGNTWSNPPSIGACEYIENPSV